MSDQSRKVKNPLLTAAGQGFPFESYSTSALLMPVTPATPAILQDAGPEENLLGSEAISGIQPQPPISSEIVFPASPEIETIAHKVEPSQSLRSELSTDQPAKQGYFTSILSSLPNLSLSSITGESSTSSQPKSANPNPGASRESYGFSQNPYEASSTYGSFVATNQSVETSGQYLQGSQGFGDVRSTGATTASGPIRPPPTLPTLPPSGGPGSYRLGNQRRLKYAPPPDLTSNNPTQYPTPPVQSFFTPISTSASVSDFLNPNIPSSSSISSSQSSPGSLANVNLPSSTVGLQSSQSYSSGFPTTSGSRIHQQPSLPASQNFPNTVQSRPPTNYYNPGSTGPSGVSEISSLPREIPSRYPEPATPQNTPANNSYAGFASSYASDQTVPNFVSPVRVESGVPTRFTISPESPKIQVPNSGNQRSDSSTVAAITESVSSTYDDTPTTSVGDDKSFTPISAAKVTAKLEHLLAEREEDAQFRKIESLPAGLKSEEQRTPFKPEAESNRQTEPEILEDLAEIDLTGNDSTTFPRPNPAASQISSGLDFPQNLDSENFTRSHFSTPSTETNANSRSDSVVESRNQNFESLPSVGNFFNAGSDQPGSQSNYFSVQNEGPVPAFFNPQSSEQQTGSAFFNPTAVTSNAPSAFFTAAVNSQQVASTNSPQPPPVFYNPGEFATTSRDPSFAIFTPQIPASTSFGSVLSSSPPTFATSGSFMATAMPEPTGSATLNPSQMSVNPGHGRSNSGTIPPSLQSLAAGPADRRTQYRPVYHHWFYRQEVEGKVLWLPFSMQDSLSLEEIHNSSEITPETTVPTDGGRFDVDILRRRRSPVYWSGNPTEVRRSSWFYRSSTESRYTPYEESTSARLEDEYKQACVTDNWNRRVELNNGEYIIFHSPTVQVHYAPATSPEIATSWGNSADSESSGYLQGAASRPKVVKRGVDEFNIDEGEPEKVDHLLFLIHGVGSVCDLKFRTVEEVVHELRSISLQLVESHYRTASIHGVVNRIEVLPISWHTVLHSEDTGIDDKLRAITLESIPRLRHFTNDTLLDVLFYTSPTYCQTIMQAVGTELNRLYALFKERNPNFGGSVYLGGHSLGSLILFDLLCHQKPPAEESVDEVDPKLSNPANKSDDDTVGSMKSVPVPKPKRRLSKKVSYVMGAAGTGQPFINYPQLSFHPQAFFALGSPIGMFVTIRGIDTLGEDFVLPTCPAFFNIFHPFDPVAYRVESLINSDAKKYRPMLIPHHKGRKRMHLELKETMARVGADLKQKLLDSVRSTWNSVYQLAMFHRSDNQSLEQEIDKVVEEELQKSSVNEQQNDDDGGADFRVGKLNGGRRIDYVLQEAPFEYINEYLFALTSHVCYWESEDTMLMILKEIYGKNGIQADAQLPPQTMTIERISPSSSSRQSPSVVAPIGYDPTAPMSHKSVGPPPVSGFVRKS